MNKTELLAKQMLLRLIPIQVLAIMTYSINGMIDSYIGSNFIGSSAMTAIGLLSPILTLITSITNVISSGALILITACLGRNDKKKAKQLFDQSLLLSIGIAIIVSFVMIFFNKPIAIMAGGNQGNTYLSDYIIGIGLFFVFQILSTFLISFLPLIGEDKKTYLSIFVMILCNAVLDIVFIIGLKSGVFGLGIATGISYLFQLFVLLPPYLKKNALLKIGFAKFELKSIGEVAQNGLPSEIGWFANGFKGMIINTLLLSFGGASAVAAMAIENNICGILGALVVGISIALLMCASLFASEEDIVSLKYVVNYAVKLGLMVTIAIMVFIMALSGPISSIFFSKEPYVYQTTARALFLFPLYLPFNMLLFAILKVLQAQQYSTSSSAFSLIEGFMPALTALLLTRIIGLDGVWLSLAAADLIVILLIFVYTSIKKKKITLKLKDIMMIPDDYGTIENDRIDISLHSIDEAINLSESICEFCKAHHFDEKKTFISGLAIEEMSVIIFKYAMKEIRYPQVDVRCLV